MKATSEEAMTALEIPKTEPRWMADFMALTKARLTLLVLITTFVGFCMASEGKLNWVLLFHTLVGTALVAGGAAVLNQVIENKVDALMRRTRNRPLPAGRMKVSFALVLGAVAGVFGCFYLFYFVNFLTAILAAITLLIYIALYTPMKRRTAICVLVGAVSGAIPPVIGWAAVKPSLGAPIAWVLFGVLFLWQMPHFLAIAWLYRDEYADAGFVMLRRRDTSGVLTAVESFVYTLALVVVTLVPAFLGHARSFYTIGALLLGGVMLVCAARFLLDRSDNAARQLFFASILYLPILLGLMVFTKA